MLQSDVLGRRGRAHHIELGVGGQIMHDDLEHEAIQLRFRQWVGAFEFDGILSGEDEERLFQLVGLALDGDAVFLHGLQEGGLGFRRGAIDLVGEDDVREYGAWQKDQLSASCLRIFLHQIRAGDVRWHQIRRELNARKAEIQNLGKRMDEQGFRQTGDTDDQAVTAYQNGQQDQFDDIFLTVNDLGDLRAHLVVTLLQFLRQSDVVIVVELCAVAACCCVHIVFLSVEVLIVDDVTA